VTEGFNAFVTVAVSCVVWPLLSAALAGLTLTVTEGSSVIVADEDAVVSARLVAVTVTVCAVVMVVGAVYRPDVLIVPIPTGLTDHVTALLAALATVAVSCVVWPLLSAALAGLTLTVTEGSSVIVADEDAVVSARLVAVTVTVCAVVMVVGAVYRPDALIVPTPTGLTDHVTALFAALVTVAVSCVVWPLFSADVARLTLTETEGTSVIVADEDAVVSARLVAVTVTVCAVVMVVGAVYRPDAPIVPTPTGLTDHVTALFAALVTVAVSCVVWPLLSAEVAGLTLTMTGGAVPFRVMVCADGDALSVIVMAAVKEPDVTGVKSPIIVQLLPAARLAGQLLDSLKLFAPIPDRVIVEILRAELPVLESVTV
jgi:hypothetical protein